MEQKLKTSEEAATPDDYFNQVVLLHSRETKRNWSIEEKEKLGHFSNYSTHVDDTHHTCVFCRFHDDHEQKWPWGHSRISTSLLLKLANHTTTRGRCMTCHTRQ